MTFDHIRMGIAEPSDVTRGGLGITCDGGCVDRPRDPGRSVRQTLRGRMDAGLALVAALTGDRLMVPEAGGG